MAAFLAKLPFLSSDHTDKVESWGSARYKDFRVVDIQCPESEEETPLCLAGGLFRTPPRSLKHLQRLVNTNLTNWGVARPSYEHGWLRLVSRDEAREKLGLKAEAERECAQIVRQIVEVGMWKEVAANAAKRQAQQAARRARACELLAGLAAPLRSLAIGFGGLAATSAQRRAERADKASSFNLERFGLAGGYVSYSQAELDECSGWASVKRRRLGEPADPWRDRQDLLRSREALERAAQQTRPVGL
jgi:hypothetical protein